MDPKPKQENQPPKPRGRPATKPIPEPIPDTPENVMKALVSAPPRAKNDWDYLKNSKG